VAEKSGICGTSRGINTGKIDPERFDTKVKIYRAGTTVYFSKPGYRLNRLKYMDFRKNDI